MTLNLGCGSQRILCITDGPADHEIISTILQRLATETVRFWSSWLSTGRIPGTTISNDLPASRVTDRLLTGSNNTKTTVMDRPAGSGDDQLAHVTVETKIVQVSSIQTGQHGNGKDSEIFRSISRGLHDGIVSMHRGKGDAPALELTDGPPNCSGHIKELQIDKTFFPRSVSQSPSKGLTAHEKLEAKFVEHDLTSELTY
ncbi:MAG: hypothetical protein CM1200mP20_02980 [Pseudomonadota bacterium]|nr:MAG: hypothetical protein CM1200mP20_02980 [Pseudomonadota bacterium]